MMSLFSAKYPLVLMVVAGFAYAQTIYKSVDENGNVVYSDGPPQNPQSGEVVAIPAGPSQEEQRAGEQRLQRMLSESERIDAERKQREQERYRNQERQRLKQKEEISHAQQQELQKMNKKLDRLARKRNRRRYLRRDDRHEWRRGIIGRSVSRVCPYGYYDRYDAGYHERHRERHERRSEWRESRYDDLGDILSSESWGFDN